MNTALILHLLALVQHIIHGHHFRTVIVPECFEWVRVSTSHPVIHRLVCGQIEFGEHFALVKWR